MRARRVEAEWVIKVEERGTAAFGEREPSRFWWNWRVVEIFITNKEAELGLVVKSARW